MKSKDEQTDSLFGIISLAAIMLLPFITYKTGGGLKNKSPQNHSPFNKIERVVR